MKHAPWKQPWWRPTPGDRLFFAWIVLIHVGAVVGLVLTPIPGWTALVGAVVLHLLGGLGTTVGYHRAIAHKSVKLHPVVRHVLTFFATDERVGLTAVVGRVPPPSPREIGHARGHLQPARGWLLVVAPALAVAGRFGADREVLPRHRQTRRTASGRACRSRWSSCRSASARRWAWRRSSGWARSAW